MSQENVEILRRFAKVFQTGDLERVVSQFFDPEIEWRTSAEDPDAATYRGPEAYKRYVEQWWESFEGLQAQVEEYIDAGDQVIVRIAQKGRGDDSGVPVTGTFWFVLGVRNQKVVTLDMYATREEALEATGLKDQ